MSKQFSSDKNGKSSGKPAGNRREAGKDGFKKFFKGEGTKPSRDKSEGPSRKFGSDNDRRFKKEDGDRRFRKDDGERGFKKSFGNDRDERGPRKKFDGNQSSKGAFTRDDNRFDGEKPRPYGSRSFGERGGSRGGNDTRGKSRSFDGEKRPFNKSFDKKPREFGDEKRSFNKPFDKKSRDFGDEKRSFNKPFDKRSKDFGDEKRSFNKPFDKKSRDFGDEKRSFNKPFDKRSKDFGDKPQKTDRYANTFGKLDDEELAAHQQKMKARKEEKEKGEEVTFSKSIDKWSDQEERKDFGGKQDRKDFKPEDRKHRHSKSDEFKRQFDNENADEKVYASRPDGRPRKKKYAFEEEDDDEAEFVSDQPAKMPLNKYIAHCDVCSRRDAVELIKSGRVKVNDEVVKEPGYKIAEGDVIMLNDKVLSVQKNLVYILMNKPKGYITTTDDPKGRRTVMQILEDHIEERVFPIGRLDRATTGLLLLTNDGDLAQKLAHPKYECRKVYQVTTNKDVSKEDFQKILNGLTLEDGPVKVDALEYLNSPTELGLEIHSGKNRIVRRIFESLGYEVEKLDRVMYAGLTKKNVLRGKWRFLTKQEVINLKHIH